MARTEGQGGKEKDREGQETGGNNSGEKERRGGEKRRRAAEEGRFILLGKTPRKHIFDQILNFGGSCNHLFHHSGNDTVDTGVLYHAKFYLNQYSLSLLRGKPQI